MKELLLKAIELPAAERYRLAFLLAENLGYVLTKGHELRRRERLEEHDALVARGEAEPL